MTQKRLELKNEIKSLAQQIKDGHKQYKSYQKVFIPISQSYTQGLIGWDKYVEEVKKCNAQFPVQKGGYFEFRSKHIVASLLRGKTRLQIESRVKPNDWIDSRVESKVKDLIEEYKNEVWFDISLLNKNDKEGAFVNMPLKETA